MNKKQRKWRNRIVVALALFAVICATEHLLPLADMARQPQAAAVCLLFALYLVPYLIAGHDVLLRAAQQHRTRPSVRREPPHGRRHHWRIRHGRCSPTRSPQMAEGAAVMLFYQVGELFQSYAVGKSRKSIADP